MAIDSLPDAAVGIPTSVTDNGSAAVLPSPDRRTALARAIIRIAARAIPEDARLTIALDGETPANGTAGRVMGPDIDSSPSTQPGRRAHVRVHGPDAVARIVGTPTEGGIADAFLRGDLEIDGDVATAIEATRRLDPRRLTPVDMRRLVRYGLELRRGRVAASPLARRSRLAGSRHSRARDMEAVRFHYDVGESFYRLWLDSRLAYSCAYFERDDDPANDLDAAQEAKLDLICRKLDLRPGRRLLDIGCGWGSLILFAAERYKVEAVGVTLSERQATEANRRAVLLGLESRARAEVRDYRDLDPLGPFDAVASVGMFEHVGEANLRAYFAAARDALVPGGRFLNHGIATNGRGRRGAGSLRKADFVQKYVFPDGELVPVERAVAAARDDAGLELLDVQLLRPHYALTLQAWVVRLERSWDQAVAAAGDEVARTWRLYMSAARVGFERGDLDVAQLLLARPIGEGAPAPRPLRPWW